MDLCDAGQIRELLVRYGLRPTKARGQNFLTAGWVARDIAEASGAGKGSGVLEIGPGIGSLTRELCRHAGKVVSVELDRGLLPVLGETMAGEDNFTLLHGDILKIDLKQVVAEHFEGLTAIACANLPYNITSPALTALVGSGSFETVTVMVQREVAERIAAKPGTGSYGAFSVYMQYHTEPELLFTVPAGCFLPPPKVTSAVVRCRRRRPQPPECGEEFYFRVVRGAFAQRRKTMANSLSSAFPELSKEQLSGCIEACGFPGDVRGERLSGEEFVKLSDKIAGAAAGSRDG